MSAPQHPDEARRLAVVHALQMLDTPSEAGLDALADCAARITGAPIALISLIDGSRQWFKARHGFELPQVDREQAFCAHAILGEVLLEVDDLRADARFRDSPFVTAAPHLRFYASQPLLVDGQAVGTLCVFDTVPRRLGAAERDTLRQLGTAAAGLLQSRRRVDDGDRQRARLLDFARAAGDWMWESDAEHRLTWASETFETVTGSPTAIRIGESIAGLALLDDQGRPLPDGRCFEEVLARHTTFSRRLVGLNTARGPLAVSRSAVPVFDAAGRFAGYRGTARDVTAALAAQTLARDNAALLRQLAAQVPGALFSHHEVPGGRSSYPFVSDGVVALLGLTPEQLRADASLYGRCVHPDDRAALRAALAEAAARRTPSRQVYRVQRGDGALRWVESRAVPTPLPDGSTLWHGFTADITERQLTEAALREHEERWRLAADAAGIGIAQFTLADGLVHLDERACANHGLREMPARFGLADWLAQIDPADRDAAARGVQQALDGSAPFEGRYRIHRPDGSLRWLEFILRATPGADGRPNGVIGTCRDVHEQQSASELQRHADAAERANQAKSEFLSRVSHELRTPLNAILGFAQLMELDHAQPLAGEQGRRLANVQRAGRHLLGLINDVLDLSRIQHTEFALTALPVDLAALLRASLALMQPLADARGIRFEGADAPPAWVRGDARAIEQVLMNLLSNAIKYSPAGASVLLRLVHDGPDTLLRVHDRGPGLSAAQQAQLFQPFARLGAEALRIEGTGLGLVIARQLVETMGGRIEVDSTPGVGSTFGVRLQACAAPAATHDTAAAAPAAASPAPAVAARARSVLYIEDEPLNQLLLQELFRARPAWRLQIAPDGASGLARLRGQRPDLLLVDMNLPDTSGVALVRTLRADAALRSLPCIALSADALPEQIVAAREAGFDDYWTKPIDVTQVLQRLDRLLG